MVKSIVCFFGTLLCIASCKPASQSIKANTSVEHIETQVNSVLDLWHKAAAEANYDAYFNQMASKSVFIGTDATENWQIDAFKTFSKPYFDKGKAWRFSALERNIYVANNKEIVWFDELLDTQMKLCRGSGVLVFENDQWKIAHYVLSITIPNENVKEVVMLKKQQDSLLTLKFR